MLGGAFGFLNGQKRNTRLGVESCAPDAVRRRHTNLLYMRVCEQSKYLQEVKTGGSQGKDQSKTEELRPHSH